MTVTLLYNTPLWVCSKAIRKCWSSEDKSDTVYNVTWGDSIPLNTNDIPTYDKEAIICGDADKALIERVGNKNKHKSTLEHLVYTFDIDGISRACLQELARHRMASYSVKSTRYTLKELKDANNVHELSYNELDKWLVFPEDAIELLTPTISQMKWIQERLRDGWSNDKVKYMLPEAYKTSLVMTINARSLQNFLELRSSKSALWEIRELALNIYKAIPEEHKYLFEESIKDKQ